MSRVPFAGQCLFCRQAYTALGGKRLCATQLYGFSFESGQQSRLGGVQLTLADGRTLVVWGHRFNKPMREVLQVTCNQGYLPWFCQACAGRCCTVCGAPWNRPVAASYWEAAGNVVHCASLGAPTRCQNGHIV